MTENLVAAILIFVGLLALVPFTRRDAFAGHSLRYRPYDELGYRDSPLIGRPA
jgi:hypothetical protein